MCVISKMYLLLPAYNARKILDCTLHNDLTGAKSY